MVSSAASEASVLGPDCPYDLGRGPVCSCVSAPGLLSSLLKEALGMLVAVTLFLNPTCSRETFPGMDSRTKYAG